MNQVACSAQFYQLGDQRSFKIDIALSIPNDIHVKLDAAILGLVDVHLGNPYRLVAQVDLDETERREGSRKGGGEDRLNDLLDHPAASDVDVGP